jgi:hypothetical protein
MQMCGGVSFGRAKFYGVPTLSRHGRTITALRNLAKGFSREKQNVSGQAQMEG